MKTSKAQIDNFLSQPVIAMAGYSRNSKKFGASVYKTLVEKGFKIVPVNPAGGVTEEGEPIYQSVELLPDHVKALFILTKPEVTKQVVSQALQKGITHFWIQQFSEDSEVMEMVKDQPNLVTGQCIFLHTQPQGFHKIHWWFAKIFGTLPS